MLTDFKVEIVDKIFRTSNSFCSILFFILVSRQWLRQLIKLSNYQIIKLSITIKIIKIIKTQKLYIQYDLILIFYYRNENLTYSMFNLFLHTAFKKLFQNFQHSFRPKASGSTEEKKASILIIKFCTSSRFTSCKEHSLGIIFDK